MPISQPILLTVVSVIFEAIILNKLLEKSYEKFRTISQNELRNRSSQSVEKEPEIVRGKETSKREIAFGRKDYTVLKIYYRPKRI